MKREKIINEKETDVGRKADIMVSLSFLCVIHFFVLWVYLAALPILNLRTSEIHLFYNLQFFYWHFLEILWLFIFLILYCLNINYWYSFFYYYLLFIVFFLWFHFFYLLLKIICYLQFIIVGFLLVIYSFLLFTYLIWVVVVLL